MKSHRYLLLLKDLIGCTDNGGSEHSVHTLVSKSEFYPMFSTLIIEHYFLVTLSLNTSLHTHPQTFFASFTASEEAVVIPVTTTGGRGGGEEGVVVIVGGNTGLLKRYSLDLAGRNSHQVDGAENKGQHEHGKGLAAVRLSELLATKT